jgi:hypothetical protein
MCNSFNSLPYANYIRVVPVISPTHEVHTLTTIHSTQTTYKTVTLVRSTKSLQAPPHPTPISTELDESTTTVHSTSTVYLTKTRTSTRSRLSTRPGPASITGYLSVTIPTELVPHSTEDWYTIETSVPGDTLTDGTYSSWGATSKSQGDTTTSTSIVYEPTMSSGYDFPTMSPSMVDGTTSGIFYSLSAVSSTLVHSSGHVHNSFTHGHGTTYGHPTSYTFVTGTADSTPALPWPTSPIHTATSVDSFTFVEPTWYFPTASSAASSTHVHSYTHVHSSTHVYSTSYAVPTSSDSTSTASDAVPTSFGSTPTEPGYGVPTSSDSTSTASDAVPTSFGSTPTEPGYGVPTFSKRAVEGKAVSEKEASVTVASFAALFFTLLAAALAV